METVAQMAGRWDIEGFNSFSGKLFAEIHKRITYLHKQYFHQYVPTVTPQHGDFHQRLGDWLANTSDERTKRILLELVPQLVFFSREDFNKLYQVALTGPITRWIVDQLKLNFDGLYLDHLNNEIHNHTWYCPVTDSMPISDFHHVNHLGGIDYRPDWRSLAQFGDPKKVSDYMNGGHSRPLKRIVLLEDFVGSGTQMYDAVQYAARVSATAPVLFVPLIICPVGAAFARKVEKSFPQFRFEPILELKPGDMITESRLFEPTFEGMVASICNAIFPQIVGNDAATPRPYSPFGFPPNPGTGSLVVLYSNTPANTLPLVQHTSDTWRALFPRSARIR